LNAARANFLPALLVQALMGGLVVSYFCLPTARPVFGVLTDWNVHGGLLFSSVAMGITVGGLTEIFTVYLHKNARWTSQDLANMSFNFAVFGLLGVMNSVFYQMQAHWFGSGRSPGVLVAKTLVTALESPRTDQVAKDWDAKAATGRPLSPGHTGVNSFE
jgi:hypothetical protein